MENNKQTAVEWLENVITSRIIRRNPHDTIIIQTAFDFAKIMEKGQIIEAYEIGESEWTDITYENGNDYYNKTYDTKRTSRTTTTRI